MVVPKDRLEDFELSEAQLQQFSVAGHSKDKTYNGKFLYDGRNLTLCSSSEDVIFTITIKPEVRAKLGSTEDLEKKYKKLRKQGKSNGITV